MANKQTITVASQGCSSTILLSLVARITRSGTVVQALDETNDPVLEADLDDEAEAIRVEKVLVDAWNAYLEWVVDGE